jgi:uncharacterized protein (PEP-CTERM system associated)
MLGRIAVLDYKNMKLCAWPLIENRITQFVLGWLLMPFLLLVFFEPSAAQYVGGGTGEWQITPKISAGTTYSDNIKLVPAGEAESDLILEVEPGLSVRKQGGNLDLRLDYTAQGVFYTNNSDANKITNQLQAFGTAQIVKNNLFLDAYGAIKQIPINTNATTDAGNLDAGGRAATNLSLFTNLDLPGAAGLFNLAQVFNDLALTNNQVTSYFFGVSPYWHQQIGGWANALIRYRYDHISYDSPDTVNNSQSQPQFNNPDSELHAIELKLANDRQFSALRWRLDYSYQKQKRSDQQTSTSVNGVSADDLRESLFGQIMYRLDNKWFFLAEAGYENNQVADFLDSQDGAYWGLGALWMPSRFVQLKGLYSPNVNELALNWSPGTRTSLELSRRDQAIGLNSGVHWQGSFKHRAAYTEWSATYTDEVTNEQQLLGSSLTTTGAGGQPLPVDGQGQSVVSEGPMGLTNQNFRRKRLDAGVVYHRGVTGLSINLFNEDRESPTSGATQNTYGTNALWTWRFGARTASFIGTGWEHDDLGENKLKESQQTDYWVSVIGLARVFSPNSGSLISYRFYKNDTDLMEQAFRENRLNIRFNMKF